jgi:predicted P-loop ATPase
MASVTRLPQPDWRDRLQLNASGTVKANLFNICMALRHANEFRGAIRWNDMALRSDVLQPLPWSDQTDREWSPHDDNKLNEWLQIQSIDAKIQTVCQAVETVAHEQNYHPVRDWLETLKWDGHKRVDTWLTYYLGADDTPYNRAVGKAWLVSAVARIMRPGCKADHLLILEGVQGLKKSSALKALAGERFFTDELAAVHSKDASEQLRGVWIIELAELDAHLKRAREAAEVKNFLSRTVDRYRPAYGRRVIEAPRECVFCGSVNQDEYLGDETGNRRFWPVRCGSAIDVAAIRNDRAQIWAEALKEYRDGALWWLDDHDLQEDARREQASRLEVDSWDDLVLDFAAKSMFTPTTRELLCDGVGLRASEIKKTDEIRIAKIMKSASYKRDTGRGERNRMKVWWPLGSEKNPKKTTFGSETA